MNKKSLIMVLCLVLALGSAAFGTIAYLTDRESVTNTFTVGNVNITVDETKVNEDGEPVDADGNVWVDDPTTEDDAPAKTIENKYHLVPGKSYVKDPTLTVEDGSEEAYVRMLVTVDNYAELKALCEELTAANPTDYPYGLPQDHVNGYDATKWICNVAATKEDTTANTVTYEFRYHTTVSGKTGAVKLEPLFTEIKVPGEIDGETLAQFDDLTITVVGQAIQATAGVFADENAAWAAYETQMTVAP